MYSEIFYLIEYYKFFENMVLRCELCDNYRSIFQFSSLCDCCYKIRTIIKCYNREEVLRVLQENFLVQRVNEEEPPQENSVEPSATAVLLGEKKKTSI